MRRYLEAHQIPFRGIPDPGGELLWAFGQEWRLLAFGRMPARLAYAPDGREVTRHSAAPRGTSAISMPSSPS